MKFIERDEIFSKSVLLTCVISEAKPVSLFVYHRPVLEKIVSFEKIPNLTVYDANFPNL